MRENRQILIVGAVAGLVLVAGMFIDADRVWSNLLIGTFFLLTIGLGGAVFVALNYVTGAGWSAAFRRVPELLGYRSLAQSVDVIHPAYLFEMIHVQHFQ